MGGDHPRPRPAADEDAVREDRIILSFTLLIATLLAGFVTSVTLAETPRALTVMVGIPN
jgi:hypothetical protein